MSYPFSQLGADSYGPPRPGQSDADFQQQMSVPAMAGLAALAILVPPVGIAAAVGYLLTRPAPVRAANRFPREEIKGGH